MASGRQKSRGPRRVRALSPFVTGRGAANARAARAATGAGDAIDLGRRPAGRETKRERAEETGKTRRGQREGEALWKAREDVMGDAWALSTRIPSTRGGAGAPRAAREQETTMPPREKIAMVVKRAYLRALDESSLRVGRGAPLRVPRHTITSSNFLVVRDLGPEKSWRAGLPRAQCRFWTHDTSSRVRPHARADPVARRARRAEGAGRISLARSLVAPAAISTLGCSGERTGGARRRSPSAFGVNGSLTRPRRRLLARRHGSPPGRRGHS